MNNNKTWFRYIVLVGVALIPFIYAFFYLKAYWDPYGKGNMDNIPVAIVNNDKGEKGEELTNKIIDKKVLDFEKTSTNKANNGLNNKKYYAVITIPEDFTSNLESGSKDNKIPAYITYSPNQKTNYLASQIISRVLLSVEEEIRSEVSSEVVSNLSDKLKEVPDKLNEIEDGTTKLENGSIELSNGLNTLNSKYNDFDNGINTLHNGSEKLSTGLNEVQNGISSLKDGTHNLNNGVKEINKALENTNTDKINDLTNGIHNLKSGTDSINTGISNYIDGTEQLAGGVISLNSNLETMKAYYQQLYIQELDLDKKNQYMGAIGTIDGILNNTSYQLLQVGSNSLIDTTEYGVTKGTVLKSGINSVNDGVNILDSNTNEIGALGKGINELKTNLKKVESGTDKLENGINKLDTAGNQIVNGSNSITNGLSTLQYSSKEVKNGINKLSTGSNELTSGLTTLNKAVSDGKNTSRKELTKLDGLNKFTANSVKVNEKAVNKVDSYGVAFAPFFMSIALWVGSLMLFIILYYDVDDRFPIFSRNADNKLKRTIAYLSIASIQGIVLGLLLLMGLDLHITNIFLYFISLILVACLFASIMEFLIVHFKDIGKFIALILLVLQLAAAGGTFPIETVTKGFRFLNSFLPMKYTCDLFKESVMTFENKLFTNNILVISIILFILITINIIYDKKITK